MGGDQPPVVVVQRDINHAMFKYFQVVIVLVGGVVNVYRVNINKGRLPIIVAVIKKNSIECATIDHSDHPVNFLRRIKIEIKGWMMLNPGRKVG